MRNENRTFRPEPFQRWLGTFQIVFIVIGLLIWCKLKTALAVFSVDTRSFVIECIKLAIFSFATISLMQIVRFFLFRFIGKAPKEGVHLGFLWGKGGMISCKCLAAINAWAYRLTILICIFPFVALLTIGLWLSLFLCYACGVLGIASFLGDVAVLWRLRDIPKNSWVQESPFAPGCEVYLPR